MRKNGNEEEEWRQLDHQLDLELEATFPASDAPKITLTGARRPVASDVEGEQNPKRK
jgi:hypothetical protein